MCDGNLNCVDGSDEDKCKLVQIPEGYDSGKPPKKKLDSLVYTVHN